MSAPAGDVLDVEALCGIEAGLTDWEVSFAEDLHRQVLDEGRALTKRQREKLDQILERFDL